ncbi:hypothetical protein SY83_05905 [Paenibacillus swuensis]|uniref:DUF1934 domain-containing protein n=1 Tax=Paenibacillus swuensis TaxID=1178515 RepID=A0A172TG19_9BACL|nr:DUF1934 domain-containing protein [Paenibacillus swuensis]ANE45902.1 hypothetical protein SY83_05905 [Paenibacillus swuensis]
MATGTTVQLTVESRHDGETYVQQVEGSLYRKEGTVYLRYPETDEAMGRTMTTVKIVPMEVKIIRHGEVESDQMFMVGRKLPGTYRTPFTALSLETDTQRIEADIAENTGKLQLNYDLYVNGELAGNYTIKMNYQEV